MSEVPLTEEEEKVRLATCRQISYLYTLAKRPGQSMEEGSSDEKDVEGEARTLGIGWWSL